MLGVFTARDFRRQSLGHDLQGPAAARGRRRAYSSAKPSPSSRAAPAKPRSTGASSSKLTTSSNPDPQHRRRQGGAVLHRQPAPDRTWQRRQYASNPRLIASKAGSSSAAPITSTSRARPPSPIRAKTGDRSPLLLAAPDRSPARGRRTPRRFHSKDVTVIVKRMGGGFGGKESQGAPFAAYAALVARKLGKPARVVISKDDDMVMTGKRNPFENNYNVGFDDEGRILSLLTSSSFPTAAPTPISRPRSWSARCSTATTPTSSPTSASTGQVCRTHYHPHTAFRGFGGPKGVATIEHIIEEIAHVLKKDPLDIRKLNVYRQAATTSPITARRSRTTACLSSFDSSRRTATTASVAAKIQSTTLADAPTCAASR